MAKGAQDWVARTDILLQTLQELIIRPKYGTRGLLEFQNYVTASAETSLGVITGKGVIYGGAVIVSGAATCGLDAVGSADDGGLHYFTPNFAYCNLFSLTAQHGYTWQLECYDDVLFYYALSANAGITFETSFEFFYQEGSGRTPLVISKLMYAVL